MFTLELKLSSFYLPLYTVSVQNVCRYAKLASFVFVWVTRDFDTTSTSAFNKISEQSHWRGSCPCA